MKYRSSSALLCCFWVTGCVLILLVCLYATFKSDSTFVQPNSDPPSTHKNIDDTKIKFDLSELQKKRINKYRRKWAGNGINIDDENFQKMTEEWKAKLLQKLICLRMKKESIYMYHIRRAAGSTVRDVLHKVALRWGARYHETEGPVLNENFLNLPGLLTITTLRDPITRASSLYWAEHVGWFDGILRQPEKCSTYREWVNAWRDNSQWKSEFVAANPGNLYVEIENYYVKALTGWQGNTTISAVDLEKAKKGVGIVRFGVFKRLDVR
mmetsp:Transcript_19745/g.28201  ORF Transcript_19745/g.28201 Transcript_19745/m.28201 type:complete len:268 (-) Transcript_19745:709-1512(-)